MNKEFKSFLLECTNATHCEEIEIIQSLWSGYGKISRCRLENGLMPTSVVKHISLTKANEHPRGWNTDFSHQRKIKSYKVEANWYGNWSQKCSDNCRVPRFLGSFSKDFDQWIVMEDLDLYYPIRKQKLEIEEAKLCLKWLAHFHATFMQQEPDGLWEIGTYWHLKTRPDEFERIEDVKLKEKAPIMDALLNNCKYKTVVHGDAKVANFCFSKDMKRAAVVDFQYAGGGCGIKDVAYFLGSCLTSTECDRYENELLDFYFIELAMALNEIKSTVNLTELEKEWRSLYPIACSDFIRFLMGWMPTHQKVNQYNLGILRKVLTQL